MLIRFLAILLTCAVLLLTGDAYAQSAPAVAGMPAPASAPAAAPAAAVPAPAGAASATPATPARPQGFGPDGLFIMMAGLLLVMILMSVFAGRKDRKRRAELMASLEKGAKVQTTGGIIGVITEMGDDEVVLRVEEGRVRFAKTAIAAVLKSARDKAAPADVEVKGDRARSAASV